MRTCILHIGAPKAGSTTIQGLLGERRAALAARGIDVPDLGFGDVVRGPIELIGALPQETDPARPATEAWRKLDAWLAATRETVCISRESIGAHFSRENQFDFVRAFFERRGFRLKLVAYVRDHAEFMNAVYTQQAKKLRPVGGFDRWAARMIADPPTRFSYWRMVRRALREGVEVAATPLGLVAEGGLVADFLNHLGVPDLDLGGFDPAPYRNASPGPLATAAALKIADGLLALGVDVDARPELSRDFNRMLEARGWREQPFWGPDAETAGRLRAAYARDDERLARRLWGVAWTDEVPPRDRPQRRADDPTPQERREIDSLARAFVAHATRRPLLGRLAGMIRPRAG